MSTGTIIPPSLVDAQPPIEPKGLAKTTIVVSAFLGSLSVLLVCMRLGVRTWLSKNGTRAFGLDDWFLVLALAPFLSACITAIMSCRYGLGTRDAELSQLQMIKAAQYNTYWQLSYALSIPFCKIAIASALFRVTTRKVHRIILWIVITLSCLVLCIAILSLVLLCKPWPATWNPTLGTCGNKNIITALSYAASAVTIITDWTCAIVPYFVLKDLQMPRRVRYSLIGVLSLGVFASVAAIVRIPYFSYYSHTKDVLYYSANITIWSNCESGLGIIAASIPPLRRLFHCLRSTIGSSGKSGNASEGPLTYGASSANGSHLRRDHKGSNSVQLDSIKSPPGSSLYWAKGWKRMGDDGDSDTKNAHAMP